MRDTVSLMISCTCCRHQGQRSESRNESSKQAELHFVNEHHKKGSDSVCAVTVL